MSLKDMFMSTLNGEKMMEQFVNATLKLTPEEFIGLVQCLGLKFVDESMKPIPGDELIVSVCNSFAVRPLNQKLQLLKLVKDTTKLRATPKFNAEEQARRDSEYEEWLAEQKAKIKEMKELNEEQLDTVSGGKSI